MDLSPLLLNLGFSEKEASLYLACLELGDPTALELSRKTGIPRGSVYDTLEEMCKKGYVNQLEAGKHRVFVGEDPKLIYKKHQENLKQLNKALPELSGLFHGHEKPNVRFFDGIEGVKRVYEDSLTASTEILNFSNSAQIRVHWPTYDVDYVQKRIEKKIFLRGIALDDESGRAVQAQDDWSFRKMFLIPSKDFHFTNEINIYDHKMTIVSFGSSPMGVIIESQPIADTQRDIFKMAWTFAQALKKEGRRGLFRFSAMD